MIIKYKNFIEFNYCSSLHVFFKRDKILNIDTIYKKIRSNLIKKILKIFTL
jgi:hypothetical protein